MQSLSTEQCCGNEIWQHALPASVHAAESSREYSRSLLCAFQDPSAMPRPTSQDLAGFWDLLQLSIEDVSMKFDELHQLKLNEWKIIESPERKVSRPWTIPFSPHL